MWLGKPSPCKGKSTSHLLFHVHLFAFIGFIVRLRLHLGCYLLLLLCYYVFLIVVMSFVVFMLLCLLERYTVFFACKDNNFLLKLVKEPVFFLRKV